ncbi:dCTP deaminase, dUMP-forming [subsurface metagenome]
MLMTDKMIRSAMQEGDLQIRDFFDSCLYPASYDARLGEESITSSIREKVNPAKKGLLTIPAGDFALVTTHESFELSASVAGHIGLRSHYSKKGLSILSGPQIDPGFKGVLVVGLSNLSPRDITIPYKERFCTLEFYKLAEPASEPYHGEYQGQTGISPQDLENLVEAQGMTFGQVIKLLGELSLNVKSLSDSVTFLKWIIPIAVAVLAIGITVVGILVVLD